MSSSMWNSAEFKKDIIVSPKKIVEEQCKELSRITGGKVIGILRTYDGKYKSGSYMPSGERLPKGHSSAMQDDEYLSMLEDLIPSFGKTTVEKFNVQDILGNQGDGGKFVYEIYLTSKATPHYKYRVFLLYFDAKLYPVGLSIEQSIADEIGCEAEIELPDEEAFKNILASILASNTVTSVVKNLLSF